MASPMEDQSDEDFFDKLVSDEYGITGSDYPNGTLAGSSSSFAEVVDADETDLPDKAFSKLSLREMESNGGSHEALGDCVGMAPDVPVKDVLVAEESVCLKTSDSSALGAFEEPTSLVSPQLGFEANGGLDPNDVKPGKGSNGNHTSVKEVQWSSFYAEPHQSDPSGLSSYSDFFSELGSMSSDPVGGSIDGISQKNYPSKVNPILDKKHCQGTSFRTSGYQDNSGPFGENPSSSINENELGPFISSSALKQEGSKPELDHWSSSNIGEVQSDDVNNNSNANAGQDLYSSQCWESHYPGWKYDQTTGEWHQIDGYDLKASNSDGTRATNQDSVSNQDSANGSEVSYLQQGSNSIVGIVNEEMGITGNVSSCNNFSHSGSEYQQNMVFDPQYPGWYYDLLAQEWRQLESYSQETQTNTISADHVSIHQQTQGEIGLGSSSNATEILGNSEQCHVQNGSMISYSHGKDQVHASILPQNTWYPEQISNNGTLNSLSQDRFGSEQFLGQQDSYNSTNKTEKQFGFGTVETVPSYGSSNYNYNISHTGAMLQSFVSAEKSYQFSNMVVGQNQQKYFSGDYYGEWKAGMDFSQSPIQTGNSIYEASSYGSIGGRISSGRPPHALVTFGFGGKLVIMKSPSSSFGSQDPVGGSISIHDLLDVVLDKTDVANGGNGACDYFNALCQQSFPGPLVGGSVANKDLYKWIDERIANCETSSTYFRKGELLRMLVSLLKICCQYYGKLRSPFGTDSESQEVDGPESAVTKLFASAKKYDPSSQCLLSLPSEGKIRATATEVQNLLVAGRRKEALQLAQEGQLWGPALVLAAQLGEKFYVDTVKQMAHRQFISGSPLRTLCLLIAGQQYDVFSSESEVISSHPSLGTTTQHPAKAPLNGMLDDWEENVAVITANRTKDDELVLIHLGDCLWKDRDEVTAAHTCYLVAEKNIEPFSDSARLCLIGADHFRCPRTYTSPEAIQRTEVYEYAKVLGNSQFILLPFQPYKLIYAHMLAEVGKVSDSLRYCQALTKVLKNSRRAPEVESWKSMLSSLEERVRIHQQGGYSSSIAPAKLVGKFFTTIDSTINRIIGAPPSPMPSTASNVQSSDPDSHLGFPKAGNDSLRMANATLMPSASMDPISEWTGGNHGNNGFTRHSRSISEPDFGRTPIQGTSGSKDAYSPTDTQRKTSASGGPTRLGRFGSNILQKAVGLVSRNRQAKLGEKNKFYYDEKLKRWVEEGAETPVEEAVLAPPPMTASFQNGFSDYNPNNVIKSQISPNGGHEIRSPTPTEHSSGIPPIPPTNQFSSRGRMGVRSRYVDTFNKGGGPQSNLFQSPSLPSAKPVSKAKFFVPTPSNPSESIPDNVTESTSMMNREDPFMSNALTSPSPPSSSSSSSSSSLQASSLQRHGSMDNVASMGNKGTVGNVPRTSRSRAASWSGGFANMLGGEMELMDQKPVSVAMIGMSPPSSSTPTSSLMGGIGTAYMPVNGGNLGDDLQEVEL
ncbi:protein transport protein SEC16A homolog isoform X1 [Amborella trichopoda]|uniref:Protein transport protein sec16 n=1 Tax=Amborella trichopoda TaxID=13333 RepID=W1Q0K6_AMBTC|nr:protein transport protein SEC16A homolog isoform X1 [Amborella trichopoda]ERN14089.1 hypothetical protein AMTR_s00021p00231460 [Amborella trichopoda]|eukprot:XP_006852622.1 protein transport protein SEC16A homolog isoform X1 [Amborella trichopoda]